MELFPLLNDSLSSAGISIDHVSSDNLTESVMKLKVRICTCTCIQCFIQNYSLWDDKAGWEPMTFARGE